MNRALLLTLGDLLLRYGWIVALMVVGLLALLVRALDHEG